MVVSRLADNCFLGQLDQKSKVRGGLLSRFAKFVGVGIVATCIDFFAFNLFANLGLSFDLANIFSVLLSTVIGFLGNLLFTFFDVAMDKKVKSFFLFLILGIATGLSHIITIELLLSTRPDSSQLETNFAKVAVVMVLIFIRFIVSRSFIFV